MGWTVEYYEREDTIQPAEVFEDELLRRDKKLAAKLRRVALALENSGSNLGGGLIERCRNYKGLWEMRAIFNNALGREFFGFDGDKVVLLHGYVKRVGQPASSSDLALAFKYWQGYLQTHRISPEAPEQEDTP
ncbi:MAG TPA: type II toxin-antitoxin system RelE/ParE family toxin [Ktedonobacterales bacterium]|jgi:hypothetical protein